MTGHNHKVAALVLAAGQGSRAGGDTPKQFRQVGGKAVIAHAIDAFTAHPAVDSVYLVIGAGQEDTVRALIGGGQVTSIIEGADSRRGSVRAGLEAIAAGGGADRVLIHDAARPFLSSAMIEQLLGALDRAPGAFPALPVADTLVRSADDSAGDTVDRSGLYRVQTPQAFHFDAILSAHRNWDSSREATDDAQMLRLAGHDVILVPGDERLEKLTYPQDFARAEALLASRRTTRVGMGYDVHRLAADEELWLCGVQVPHDRGLAGHSDADVAIHALVDALLGTLSEGDIGSHFPPSDPQWRGAASSRFLEYAGARVIARGGRIDHVDVTIICEAPKIGPHRDAMRQRISEILAIPLDSVSIKATTTEKLGFAGRREGIAAQAVATISLPALF
ncbi:bifunctional 2-C-methyl-D-erythritol 4-phosphate cytidylyltransferase/2-C-methyl-D-erythritol 2,4-cyclodiphosphate synthase [Novosphingobium sp. Chol11]|uniref:bifunctional 2-C-methyl-D-erythritol 4-phosphate cytidylyltransferase/2-C-methyl-D-erythritol 2,4-cyclodiphosphate synthase n=1 Tax=Novosphingobium sp. Chol11 TaxID=1385763 RepID=UPI000BE47CB8|nr:bifunctional 2-C-methyl-D-erythritol 4-phosphate cytidylyltransferase/2-C-methyl-D-erythritol 2,4-cyclodiphosphate synthase [Novosphingobium sp. Chol11]